YPPIVPPPARRPSIADAERVLSLSRIGGEGRGKGAAAGHVVGPSPTERLRARSRLSGGAGEGRFACRSNYREAVWPLTSARPRSTSSASLSCSSLLVPISAVATVGWSPFGGAAVVEVLSGADCGVEPG